jgi:Tfp pilus assembly protein PilF
LPKPEPVVRPAAAAATTPAAAATLTPTPEGRSEADQRRAEVERLTTVALNAFVVNDYAKSRKAAEKALSVDPDNKKARELMKILGALG